MRTVVHIGLHKTASTYLQRHIFPALDPGKVIYNPDDVFYFINRIFTLDIRDEDGIAKARETVAKYRERETGQTLFISSEAISQLSFVQNYEDNLNTLKRIFGDAEIILFIREQAGWLESCYKESIKHHFYQDAAAFLNFDGNAFRRSDARLNGAGLLQMDVHKADWATLIRLAKELFPAIHVFLYEDFGRDNLGETNRLLAMLGHPPLEAVPTERSNPGLSRASTDALIRYRRVLTRVGLTKRTYMHKFDRERKDVLTHDYFWTPPKQPPVTRALHALYKEPARLLRRFSIHSVLRYLDKKHPERRKQKTFSSGMISAIKAVHAKSNEELEALLGRRLPGNYMPQEPSRQSIKAA